MNTSRTETTKQPVSARTITYTAVLAAVVFAMTFIPKIPIPFGYVHLGDAVIFVSALFFPRKQAGMATAVGSALSDFIGGFPLWVIPTLIIKYVMVEAVFWIARPDKLAQKPSAVRILAGCFVSALWMIAAYTISGAVLYGSAAAGTAMLPGLIGKGVVNLAIAYGLSLCLVRMHVAPQTM